MVVSPKLLATKANNVDNCTSWPTGLLCVQTIVCVGVCEFVRPQMRFSALWCDNGSETNVFRLESRSGDLPPPLPAAIQANFRLGWAGDLFREGFPQLSPRTPGEWRNASSADPRPPTNSTAIGTGHRVAKTPHIMWPYIAAFTIDHCWVGS